MELVERVQMEVLEEQEVLGQMEVLEEQVELALSEVPLMLEDS